MTERQKLTKEEVAKHRSEQDCWVIISGQVYDLTDWLEEHPGGPDIILEHAGTDVTELWNSIHLPEFIEQHLTSKQCLGTLHSDEGSPPSTQGTSDPHSGDGAGGADESQVQSILGAQAAESLGSDDLTETSRASIPTSDDIYFSAQQQRSRFSER